MTWLAEEASGALGHGSVATYPDRPWLVWRFDYERPDAVAGMRSLHDNPDTYLKGCRALHDVFRQFARRHPDLRENGGHDFNDIAGSVRAALLTQADKAGRIAVWQDAARSGALFGTAGETITDYDGDAWKHQWDSLDDSESYNAAMDLPAWGFYQAAALHRTYVLRDLLPKHGLIAD